MGFEGESENRESWFGGFADALAGNRSPRGDKAAYRSGYIAGSVRRISQRTMMAVALAMVAVPGATLLTAAGSDPVFAAIERHRQAWEALNGAGDDQARWHETLLTAETELVDTRPTTSAGVAALRAYHQEARYRGRYYHEESWPNQYWQWRRGKG